MNIKAIISETIQEFLNEEYNNNNLYGYHCTSCKNIESINKNGFRVGERSMQGVGVYAFYNLSDNSSGNAAIGYGQRHIGNHFCIVKFQIKYPKWLLYLEKDIAEEILGADNANIVKQIESVYGSWDKYFDERSQYLPSQLRTLEFSEKLKEWASHEFNKKYSSKNLMFGDTGLADIAPFGVVFDGEYGLTFLIKKPRIIVPIGYYEIDYNKDKSISDYKPFMIASNDIINKINSDDKYAELRNANISNKEDLLMFKIKMENAQMKVRTNRDFDYYQQLIDLSDELLK